MSMFNKVTKSFQWGEHTVRMETGEIARPLRYAARLKIGRAYLSVTVRC